MHGLFSYIHVGDMAFLSPVHLHLVKNQSPRPRQLLLKFSLICTTTYYLPMELTLTFAFFIQYRPVATLQIHAWDTRGTREGHAGYIRAGDTQGTREGHAGDTRVVHKKKAGQLAQRMPHGEGAAFLSVLAHLHTN